MARNCNEYHLVTFDPGAAATGWAHIVMDCHAFSRPEEKVLRWVKEWHCGEFTGSENEQISEASHLIWRAKFGDMPYNTYTDVVTEGLTKADFVSEDFELTQMIGGRNLLSPVRLNAKLEWECYRWGITLQYQRRTMRTSVTPERLVQFGFLSPLNRNGQWTKTSRGKDMFSAMQHAIVWLRRTKEQSRKVPWKLSDGQTHNAYWDCACEEGNRCDMRHPK